MRVSRVLFAACEDSYACWRLAAHYAIKRDSDRDIWHFAAALALLLHISATWEDSNAYGHLAP